MRRQPTNHKNRAHGDDVPELRDLGNHVAKARKRRGLSQQTLAQRCGLTQGAISAIESGDRRPSLDQYFRIARALDIPIQRLIDGWDAPGWDLPKIAVQLRSLGIVDLRVKDAKVPGAFAWSEEVIAVAARGDSPDPRIVTALPAVLAWNVWDAELLAFFCRNAEAILVSLDGDPPEREIRAREAKARRRVICRIAWLVDLAIAIDRRRGFPGGCRSRQLTQFLSDLPARSQKDDLDSLGHPMVGEPRSPIRKRWRINFDAEIKEFEERAEQLVALGGGLR